MPVYEITAPDGRVFELNAPQGTTKEQALEYVKSKHAMKSGGDLSETLAKIDRMPRSTEPDHFDPQASTGSYLGEQVKKGVAAGVGMPVDAVTNAINLGIAGYGVAKNALTGSSDLPETIQDPVGGSRSIERLLQTNNIKPNSRGTEIAGRFVRDLSTAAVPGAPIAAKAANPIASLGIQGVLSASASAGGELGRSTAPAGYEDVADMSGSLVGGVAVPAMVANRLDSIQQLRDSTRPNKVNAFADRYVNDQITNDVRNYPGASQNLDDALAVEKNIPGMRFRVGQASGVPSLLDMESRVATAGPDQFNRRAIQDQQQQAAIREQAESRLPLLSGKNDLEDRLRTVQTQRSDLADALPTSQADEVGQTLRSARNSLKGRYDEIAAQKFSAPVEEAERLRVMLDSKPLISKTQEILSNPILQFDATNAPAIGRRVHEALVRHEKPGDEPKLVGPRGEPIYELRDRDFRISFTDLKAMREAVNQDIAREAGAAHPNGRQRLRALMEIRSEIDATAQQAPDNVRKLYNEAVNWYRDVYAPKFLRGVNLRQSLKDVTGESKIPDEKLASQYFKPWGTTPMDRFLSLYGDSPQAKHAMESHILDTYRKSVVKDGVIDPAKHDSFMRNYGGPLKKLPELHDQFQSMSVASNLLAQREAELIRAQKVISQGELASLKYEAMPDAGLDPRKVNTFLNKHGETFVESVSAIYGKKSAEDHLSNLREIAKAAEIADRGRLSDAAKPQQSVSPMSMQKTLGFSGRTVFSMIRAVTTGRTSPHDMAYTLGAQAGSHRINQALIAAEERAISDPETAALVAQAAKQSAKSDQGVLTLKKILAKGGLYLVGGNRYADMAKHRAAPFAIQANEPEEE